MDSPVSLHDQAQSLLTTLAAQCSGDQGDTFGSMSTAIYDTAWLSMVRKPVKADSASDASHVWLFPECFAYVITQQLYSGGWECYATSVDGILNTAAALLSLKRHLRVQPERHDWLLKAQKAEAALKQILHEWEIDSTDQVGQEILVISLLNLLEQEGITIEFPQLGALRAIRDAKLAKFPPSTIYENPSTLYHSLEAFIGYIDFDHVQRWRQKNGSMMGSPASTAAYLMNSSTWDDEAEAYLRSVIRRDNGLGCGGVPCAWPTSIFEISWVITTFAAAGVPISEGEKLVFSRFLQKTHVAQEGLLGFAPGVLPDADDTAKGLESLHYLGQSSAVESLIKTFEHGDHFLTYLGERNPSFSANCNVATVLLLREDRDEYIPAISKAIRFLTSQAFRGYVHDKWNLSEQYWMMLLARVFELIFEHHVLALKIFNHTPSLREEVPMVSLQILMRILHTQGKDDSWNGICEVTSYAILALSSLAKLPWIQQIDTGRTISSIKRGKSFLELNRNQWSTGHYLWIEKVTYSSDVLSKAYCLAASLVSIPSEVQSEPEISPGSRTFLVPEKLLLEMRHAGNLIFQTPLFSQQDSSVLRIAEIQACFALQALQRQPPDVFPRTAKGKDKYMCIIPLALTVCAALHGSSISLSVLYDMMVLSILNFHVDEYMEGMIENCFGTDLDIIRKLVQQLFHKDYPEFQEGNTISQGSKRRKVCVNGFDPKPVTQGQQFSLHDKPSTDGVRSVLQLFVARILRHPAVLSSPETLQGQLAFELETFLLAHITHAEDNICLREQNHLNDDCGTHVEGNGAKSNNQESLLQYRTPGRTFYRWVRSTSADHTSCPFSFIYFNCLVYDALSKAGRVRGDGILTSARTAYAAEDACRHLASLCRMYNDLGSLSRDADECALNSVNFPEFSFRHTQPAGITASKSASMDLLWIAEYERRGLERAMKLLEEELGPNELMGALRVFVDVTDLYGQIYVLKDIGTRTK